MADDEPEADADEGAAGTDAEDTTTQGAEDDAVSGEQSFRERVEEIRQRRAEEGSEGGSREDRVAEMFGGGGGGGGMGGNPFAQMMGGMMGGGPGPGAGGGGGDVDTERLVGALQGIREEVVDTNRQLERIADALEDE